MRLEHNLDILGQVVMHANDFVQAAHRVEKRFFHPPVRIGPRLECIGILLHIVRYKTKEWNKVVRFLLFAFLGVVF